MRGKIERATRKHLKLEYARICANSCEFARMVNHRHEPNFRQFFAGGHMSAFPYVSVLHARYSVGGGLRVCVCARPSSHQAQLPVALSTQSQAHAFIIGTTRTNSSSRVAPNKHTHLSPTAGFGVSQATLRPAYRLPCRDLARVLSKVGKTQGVRGWY